MTPPKLEACPFCGGPLQTYEAGDEHGRFAGYYLGHLYRADTGECAYGSGTYETEAEAITAHNTLARQAALFGELVQVVRAMRTLDDVLSKRWRDRLDALLTRARAAQSPAEEPSDAE
jgi:hypothetical protein